VVSSSDFAKARGRSRYATRSPQRVKQLTPTAGRHQHKAPLRVASLADSQFKLINASPRSTPTKHTERIWHMRTPWRCFGSLGRKSDLADVKKLLKYARSDIFRPSSSFRFVRWSLKFNMSERFTQRRVGAPHPWRHRCAIFSASVVKVRRGANFACELRGTTGSPTLAKVS
jgi:hypothetical protein